MHTQQYYKTHKERIKHLLARSAEDKNTKLSDVVGDSSRRECDASELMVRKRLDYKEQLKLIMSETSALVEGLMLSHREQLDAR